MTSRPAVTIAVPLYRSAKWVENIAANLRRFPDSSFEILISDRHCDDDAMEQLAGILAGDSRIRFLQQRDRAGWVQHYNCLLDEATGRYFLWMPHDDIYPDDYISALVTSLEEHPDAILAFGGLEARREDDATLPLFAAPPLTPGESWHSNIAVRLLLFWNLGIPFRGVFRRDEVLARKLYIRNTRDSINADVYWTFAMACAAPLLNVPSVVCQKQFHSGNTHTQWHLGWSHIQSAARVLRDYVGQLDSRARPKIPAAMLAVLLWSKQLPVLAPARRAVKRRVRSGYDKPVRELVKAEAEKNGHT